MIVGMDRRFAAEGSASNLATAVRHDLVDVHVELSAAARHPDVQREHLLMLAGEELIADPHNQFPLGLLKASAGVVGDGCRPLQDSVGCDHLARDQVLPDAEMLERALGLGAPQLVDWDRHLAKAIGFSTKFGHPALRLLSSSRSGTACPP